MKLTGERFVPVERDKICLERCHRYAMVLELIKGKRVLDIACGDGFGSALMADFAHSVMGVNFLESTNSSLAVHAHDKPNLNFFSMQCAST